MPVLRWASGDGLFLSFFSPIYFFRLSRRKLQHGQAPSLGFGLAVEACSESGATFIERMTAKRAREISIFVWAVLRNNIQVGGLIYAGLAGDGSDGHKPCGDGCCKSYFYIGCGNSHERGRAGSARGTRG